MVKGFVTVVLFLLNKRPFCHCWWSSSRYYNVHFIGAIGVISESSTHPVTCVSRSFPHPHHFSRVWGQDTAEGKPLRRANHFPKVFGRDLGGRPGNGSASAHQNRPFIINCYSYDQSGSGKISLKCFIKCIFYDCITHFVILKG